MKTSDHSPKFERYQHKNNLPDQHRLEDMQEFNQDPNEERIVATYKRKDRIFFYDNSSISMSYGQYNVEKCLVILFILVVYSALIIYSYCTLMDSLNFYLLVSSGILDLFISFSYLYFLVKLKSDQIFNRIPISIINVSDILILINFALKIVTMILLSVNYSILGLSAFICFIMKFLIELYFAMISVKLLMFCPCTLYVQEQTEILWNWMKYYVFCCEVEEQENPDYTKLEDLESQY